MNNKELKRYIGTKIKLLELSIREGSAKFDSLHGAYNTGYEDGELKGVYDALLMVLVLMEKSEE